MEQKGLSYGDFLREYHAHSATPHTVEDSRGAVNEDAVVATAAPKQRAKAPRKKGRIVVGLILAMLGLTSAALLILDFFLPDGVVGWAQNAFARRSAYLYAVAARADDIDEARTISNALRGQGAAGFVAFDGSYYVLLSVYPAKEQAESVATKGNYLVYPLCIDSLQADDFPLGIRNKAKDILSYPTELYDRLYQLSESVQQGGVTVAQAKITVYNLLSALQAKTESFRAAAASNSDVIVANYNASLSAVLAALDNLARSKQEGAMFLADVRWTYTLALRVNRL